MSLTRISRLFGRRCRARGASIALAVSALLCPGRELASPGAGRAGKVSGADTLVARSGWISVRLRGGLSSLSVRMAGAMRIWKEGSVVLEERGGGSFQVSAGRNGVTVSRDSKTLLAAASVVFDPAVPGGEGVFESSVGVFRGRLAVVSRGSAFDAINELHLEDWLKGVLPAEIGDAPLEALKAQAVAARSEAVHKLARPPHASEGFDFCTDVHCQVYKGVGAEKVEATRAVTETRGTVLVSGSEVIDAVYHDVCGGVTANVEDVWDAEPSAWLVSVYDSAQPVRPALRDEGALARFLESPASGTFCDSSQPGYPSYARKYYRWTKTLSAAEIAKAGGVGRVTDVVVRERCASGRVRKLQITGERGSRIIEKELPIRNALDLWSGLFVIRQEMRGQYVDRVTFVGAGHGHGVGMCQMGARTMAARGFSCPAILAHYYNGAKPRRIYE